MKSSPVLPLALLCLTGVTLRASFTQHVAFRSVAVANGPTPQDQRTDHDFTDLTSLPYTETGSFSDTNADGIAHSSVTHTAYADAGLAYLDASGTATDSTNSGAQTYLDTQFGGRSQFETYDTFHLTAPAGSWVHVTTSLAMDINAIAGTTTNTPVLNSIQGTVALTAAGYFEQPGGSPLQPSLTGDANSPTGTIYDNESYLVQLVGASTSFAYQHKFYIGGAAIENNVFNRGTASFDVVTASSFQVNIAVYADQAMTTPVSFTLITDSGHDYGANSISAAYAMATVPEPAATSLLDGLGVLVAAGLLCRRKRARWRRECERAV